MGLVKSITSVISDTWKDYFVCDSLSNKVLMVKGVKKGSGPFARNDVITNGSTFVVNEGQCAIIVDDGVVVEMANEPGNYTFDTSKSPSIFDGGLEGLKDTFNLMVERFTYGGETNRSQHLYYINTKEITGNLYGTSSPVPFKVSDPSINLNLQVMLRCNGEYTIKITNPILFYKNVAGNTDVFYKDNLDGQMKSEFLTALQPALAKLSLQGVSMYSDIPLHTIELAENLNEVLSAKWSESRGISVGSIGINSITPREEDLQRIQARQESASLSNAGEAAAHLAAAKAAALRDAAKNPNGAVNGIIGVNMMAGGQDSIADLFEADSKTKEASRFCPYCGAAVNSDAIFCSKCGKKLSE